MVETFDVQRYLTSINDDELFMAEVEVLKLLCDSTFGVIPDIVPETYVADWRDNRFQCVMTFPPTVRLRYGDFIDAFWTLGEKYLGNNTWRVWIPIRFLATPIIRV